MIPARRRLKALASNKAPVMRSMSKGSYCPNHTAHIRLVQKGSRSDANERGAELPARADRGKQHEIPVLDPSFAEALVEGHGQRRGIEIPVPIDVDGHLLPRGP